MKRLFLLSVVAAVLASCQSTPPAAEPAPTPTATPEPAAAPTPAAPDEAPAPTPDPSTIAVGGPGFSPLAQAPANTLEFALHFGHPDTVVSWSVALVSSSGTVVRTLEGQAPRLPPTLTWDGKQDSGEWAPDGTYVARLSVTAGDPAEVSTTESQPFVVDVTPPSGTLEVSPQPFAPGTGADGSSQLVRFRVSPEAGGAAVASWRLAVVHPDGRRFFDFISEEHRDNVVDWDGRMQNNATLEAGTTYDLVAQVFDRFGNVGLVKGALVVAPPPQRPAPVTVSLDGRVIAETQIYFPPFSPELTRVDPTLAAANTEALKTLAEALGAVAGARIRVIGHANQVYWQDGPAGEREQNEVLLPLSLARASAVRDALVALGLDARRFDVSGVGALGAVAPFGDPATNWKNRRVEFVVASDE